MAAARQRWGWHELDPRWAEHLVADSGVGEGALVLDVGAGSGVLTCPLLHTGATVIAFEYHPRRLKELRARFDGAARLKVVGADAADLRLPRRPFHVVANPPFGVTAALLARLVHRGSRLVSATLVLQDQAALRWAGPAAPAASRWQRDFGVDARERLPRRVFRPPPHVDTRILRLRRHV